MGKWTKERPVSDSLGLRVVSRLVVDGTWILEGKRGLLR